MTSAVVQLISLVSFGNEFLKEGILSKDFYTDKNFQDDNIKFIDFEKSIVTRLVREVIIAGDPDKWFAFLKKDGCKSLKILFQYSSDNPNRDYALSSFVGGGGMWLIEAVYENYSNYWTSKWEVISKKPDPTIWSVKYGAVAKKQPKSSPDLNLIEAKKELLEILDSISNFAYKYTFPYWGNAFKKASSNLNNPNPTISINRIIEKNYSSVAKQILFSVEAAWVFGGMASWNDWSFDDKEVNKQYNELTKKLYDVIVRSIVASINSEHYPLIA
ncbi:MAG TPA: hypothetical protein VGI43_07615 [Mucilaginibacter sp.]|jgi:hypothetical protein